MQSNSHNFLQRSVAATQVAGKDFSRAGRGSRLLYCKQVTVKVGDVVKGTAATEGEENPDWEETIEFAVPGDIVDRQDAEVSLLRARFPPLEGRHAAEKPFFQVLRNFTAIKRCRCSPTRRWVMVVPWYYRSQTTPGCPRSFPQTLPCRK